MEWELLSEHDHRAFVLVFETGDDVIEQLTLFAGESGITAAHFTAIGAFSQLILGYFDWNDKKYHEIPVNEQVEALNVAGDIAMKDDRPQVHAHAIVGRSDGSTLGGHLLKAKVRPTLELILNESPRYLQRVFDKRAGLALIRTDALPGHLPAFKKKTG